MTALKAILGIFVIVAAVYVGAELVPAYYANYEFEDAIKTEATLATYSTKSESDIRDTVFKKAQELEIPITRDQVRVQRFGLQGTGSISIEAPYVVHVELPGYPMDIHFDASTKNKGVF